jgi:hypothetical protein
MKKVEKTDEGVTSTTETEEVSEKKVVSRKGRGEKRKEIRDLLDTLNQNADPGVKVLLASEVPVDHNIRRPTGVPSIDLALAGGFPSGALSMISGAANLGKDVLVNMMMRENQRIYGEESSICLASFGAEHDGEFARKCGVAYPLTNKEFASYKERWERDWHSEMPKDVSDALKKEVGSIVVVTLGGRAEKSDKVDANPAGYLAQMILEIIESGLFQLVILNEVGGHLTKSMAEVDLSVGDKARMGDTAIFFDAFQKRFNYAIKKSSHSGPNETTCLLVSQIRIKMGGFGMQVFEDSVGGNALTHLKSVDLRLTVGAKIDGVDGKSGEKVIIGKTVNWKIAKGKHGIRDGEKGSFNYMYDGSGIAVADNLVDVGLREGLITQSGSSYSYVSLSGEEIKTKGRQAFSGNLVRANLFGEIMLRLHHQRGNHPSYYDKG